jgi:glutamate 5-kinase
MILMTDVNGIYTGPPGENGSRPIHTYSPADSAKVTFGRKSRVGLGGMESKVQCMEELGHNTWSHTNKLYFWQISIDFSG